MEFIKNLLYRYTSRKFLLALVAIIIIVFQEKLGITLSVEEIFGLVGAVTGFNVMEGYTDAQKAKFNELTEKARETLITYEEFNPSTEIYDANAKGDAPNPSA